MARSRWWSGPGALAQLVNWLAHRLAGRGLWVIPIVGFAFAWGGILIQMQEELIAFVPVLLLLVRRLGFNALIAVAISLGAAAVGAAFSPINPFQVGIAQKVAGLELLSGWEFRSACARGGLAHLDRGTMRFARTVSRPAGGAPRPSRARGRRVAAGGDPGHRAGDVRGLRRRRDPITAGTSSSCRRCSS